MRCGLLRIYCRSDRCRHKVVQIRAFPLRGPLHTARTPFLPAVLRRIAPIRPPQVWFAGVWGASRPYVVFYSPASYLPPRFYNCFAVNEHHYPQKETSCDLPDVFLSIQLFFVTLYCVYIVKINCFLRALWVSDLAPHFSIFFLSFYNTGSFHAIFAFRCFIPTGLLVANWIFLLIIYQVASIKNMNFKKK